MKLLMKWYEAEPNIAYIQTRKHKQTIVMGSIVVFTKP